MSSRAEYRSCNPRAGVCAAVRGGAAAIEGANWFSLREAGHDIRTDNLHRGAVACSFNQFPECEEYLGGVVASQPGTAESCIARFLLSWANLRRGRSRQALAHIDAISSLWRNPAASALHSLLRGLVDYPELSVQKVASAVPYTMVDGTMFVPVTIGRMSSCFLLDSGATLSLISRNEAERLGMDISELRPDAARVYGATGGSLACSTALAARLVIGECTLENVAFIVLDDDPSQCGFPYRGALGLQVLAKLETVSCAWDGKLRIGFPAQDPKLVEANLCFDGPEPVVQTAFHGCSLPMVLDTGNSTTVLWPRFAKSFSKVLQASGTASSLVISGITGESTIPSVHLPLLQLGVAARNIRLENVHVLMHRTTPNSTWIMGRMGMDFLARTPWWAIDFKCMKLRTGEGVQ